MMKLLIGHPNVVKLLAHAIYDTNRTKEAFPVMKFCEKTFGCYAGESRPVILMRDRFF